MELIALERLEYLSCTKASLSMHNLIMQDDQEREVLESAKNRYAQVDRG